MARILITSGPTRQYLDPVRYLTNASSGRMGAALAQAALETGHDVVIVSGPVSVEYPRDAKLVSVVTTEEMLQEALHWFSDCEGAIGAAAPCDYQPGIIKSQKIAKTGEPLLLELIETVDVVASLGQRKRPDQWVVGFALETEDRRFRAIAKLERKHCDLMVSNGPEAIDASVNDVEILEPNGQVVSHLTGTKADVARQIIIEIDQRLIGRSRIPGRQSPA